MPKVLWNTVFVKKGLEEGQGSYHFGYHSSYYNITYRAERFALTVNTGRPLPNKGKLYLHDMTFTRNNNVANNKAGNQLDAIILNAYYNYGCYATPHQTFEGIAKVVLEMHFPLNEDGSLRSAISGGSTKHYDKDGKLVKEFAYDECDYVRK